MLFFSLRENEWAVFSTRRTPASCTQEMSMTSLRSLLGAELEGRGKKPRGIRSVCGAVGGRGLRYNCV